MKEDEIIELAFHGILDNNLLQGRVEETHISWVILTRLYALKIKKPVTLPFLDFSTISLRKYFCEREIYLNSRFSDIYLDVLPIRLSNDSWCIGGETGDIIDYAVRMKRLRESKRMDQVLQKESVPVRYIDSLAKVIASFHLKAEIINSPFEINQARETFNDIRIIRDLVSDELGISFVQIIDESIQWSNNFLDEHTDRFQDRIRSGFRRDVHGDLHCGNIFLYRHPVLFDCIEFNDAYRQIDVLYEIAFLCMELDVFGHKELVDHFVSSYTKVFRCFETEEDEQIFDYYKCLRANVRAKVHAMTALQLQDSENRDAHVAEMKKYLSLIGNYKLNNILL